MTAYITLQDLIDRIGEEEVIVLSDRAGTGEINMDVVDRAMVDATDEINMHLSSRYVMPLPQVPETIKRLAVNLTVYWLSENDGAMSELVKERYTNGIKTLKALASGTMRLGLPETSQPGENTAGSVQITGPERIARRDTLGGLL